MKISDIFTVKTGQRIIEEEVYKHKGTIPCVTAQTVNEGIAWYADEKWLTKEHKDIIINEPCITWSKDGAKCGTLFFRDYKFYPNDHCGVLIPKDEYRDLINLKWFVYTQQEYIKNFVTQQGSQGMLYNAEMESIEVKYPFPDKEKIQDKMAAEFRKLLNISNSINKESEKIRFLLQQELELPLFREYHVGKIALLNKGSSKISEEMVYNNFEADGVPVYSSATENNGLMGWVKKECLTSSAKNGMPDELTWTTNGYAGLVFYRATKYLYSEKCGRIIIRNQYREQVLPKYLLFTLNTITFKYKTAESNNGKLDIVHMTNIPVKIPILPNGDIDVQMQKKIIGLYEKLEQIDDYLNMIDDKIKNLF